jgi:hypothetical protein
MRRLRSFFFIYVLPALAVWCGVISCHSSQSGQMFLCKHQYALCTSARCVPQPGDPTKAVCFCDVEEGASMSTVACDRLSPSTDAEGVHTVYSTFSFQQFYQGKRSMTCPEGTPWSWCLNKRCTVDPTNPQQAICTCDVVRTGKWLTLGGNCDKSTCATGYWSGATFSADQEGTAFLTKALGLAESPVKWCPDSSL